MSAARQKRRPNRIAAELKADAASRQPTAFSTKRPAIGSKLSFGKAIFSGRASWVSLTLIAAVTIIYAPVSGYQFVSWDDNLIIRDNPHISGGLTWHGIRWALTAVYHGDWHPVTWLSHMLDVQLYGLDAGNHHLTSVFFHIVTTLLVFGVLHRITAALGQSAIVAALFAVHPLHVESVAWLAARTDVISTLFWLLTMWAYVWYVSEPAIRRYALVMLSFALGLMAKPMLVTLPFVLLLMDFWPLERLSLPRNSLDRSLAGSLQGLVIAWRPLIVEKIPLFVLTVVSSIITLMGRGRPGGQLRALPDLLPLSFRVENALVSYVSYIGKTLWPTRLTVFYPYPESFSAWWVLGAVLVLVGASVMAIRTVHNSPYLLVGWLWYLGTLVPVIGLVQVGDQAMADRYTYVPLIGLFIMVAWGIPDLLASWRYRSLALRAAAVILIGGYTVAARVQVQHWENSISLWEHALAVTTGNYRAHNNLGNALAAQGNTIEAINQYNEALHIKPDFEEAHYNLGNALVKQEHVADAIAHYSEAIRLRPNYAEAHNGLGSVLDDQGKYDEAIAHYSNALRSHPDDPLVHNNLGVTLAKQGKLDEAIREFQRALRLKADFVDARNNLDVILQRKGVRQ